VSYACGPASTGASVQKAHIAASTAQAAVMVKTTRKVWRMTWASSPLRSMAAEALLTFLQWNHPFFAQSALHLV
jgi:hypothetical protein